MGPRCQKFPRPNADALWSVTKEAWDALSAEPGTVRALYEPMPQRIAKVTTSEGMYTGHCFAHKVVSALTLCKTPQCKYKTFSSSSIGRFIFTFVNALGVLHLQNQTWERSVHISRSALP